MSKCLIRLGYSWEGTPEEWKRFINHLPVESRGQTAGIETALAPYNAKIFQKDCDASLCWWVEFDSREDCLYWALVHS